MAVSHLKSTPITNLDATPAVQNTAGEGAPGYVRSVKGSVVAIAADSVDTTYRLVRVPSNAQIDSVVISSDAQGAGAVDVGVYYPTIGKTGLPDLAANAIDRDFFASAVDLASAVVATDITFEAGGTTGYAKSEYNTPIWQALGLTTDPGGFFDIVATVTTTAVTTGTGTIALRVNYSM